MCGFLFYYSSQLSETKSLKKLFKTIKWRGPDNTGYFESEKIFMAHNRLKIVGKNDLSNQPMFSSNNRFIILYNGEIYNHLNLRKKINRYFYTNSDTETLLALYEIYGKKMLEMIEGMFAFVIYDRKQDKIFIARDRFGIKPLFYYQKKNKIIFSSEVSLINSVVRSKIDRQSIKEWKIIRRPLPGKTFFRNIHEVLPANYSVINLKNNTIQTSEYWSLKKKRKKFSQKKFEKQLKEIVNDYEMNDYNNTSLISGGIDSGIIAALSKVRELYTIGMKHNNEFDIAKYNSKILKKKLVKITVTKSQLKKAWVSLIKKKGEPLYVPNEGLLYLMCKRMKKNQKVVLTGEGADELLFGYSDLFKKVYYCKNFSISFFLKEYSYSKNISISPRLKKYLNNLYKQKNKIIFFEDFFYKIHLSVLLRRMDFSTMAASKEARVPFLNHRLVEMFYRAPLKVKTDLKLFKIPLLKVFKNFKLQSFPNKIAFSARNKEHNDKYSEYNEFTKINLKTLEW